MRNRLNVKLVSGLILLVLFITIGLCPELLTRFKPFDAIIWDANTLSMAPFPPSKWHWFGTDEWGHDTLSQIVYGIIPTLLDVSILVIVVCVMSVGMAIFTTLYRPRILRFLLDVVGNTMTLVPPIVIGILLLEIPGVYFSMHSAIWYYFIISALEVARFVRVVEGDLNLIREKPFIEGAITVGCSPWQIFRRHMAPWMRPFFLEYIPAQYARILTVVGEFAYFGLFSNIHFAYSQDGGYVETRQLDWAGLLGTSIHNWFRTPNIPLFTTLGFCLLILTFRLLSSGLRDRMAVEYGGYWPWESSETKEKPTLRHGSSRKHLLAE